MPTQTLAMTLEQLRGAQKPPHGTPAYSRYVNRPLGRLFAAVCYRLGLSPNQVTLLSAAFTFAALAVLVFVQPQAWSSVAVGAGLVIGYALDSADGQVARLRGGGSRTGEWLDHMIDCLKVATMHLAVLVHLYLYWPTPGPRTLLVPVLYAVVDVVLFFGFILTDQLRRTAAGGTRPVEGSLSPVRAVAILPSDFGALAIVLGTVAWSVVFFPLYGLMFLGTAVLLVAALVKWYRALSAIDTAVNATGAATGDAVASPSTGGARPRVRTSHHSGDQDLAVLQPVPDVLSTTRRNGSTS